MTVLGPGLAPKAKPEIAAAAIAECLEAYPLDSANEALPKEKVAG